MFRYSLSWYIFTLTLLESIIKSHLTVHDNGHDFISNGRRYFQDDFSIMHEEIRALRIEDVGAFKLQLKFEPAILDFKNRPLGIPHLEKVTLFNVNKNKSIDMTSISGSTVHFHSSFFEDKKIPPMGNTSFNVIFLGREEGFVESSLFIHTTEGHFKYDVKGASIYSPYRLRPIVGIKLPINASFSPLIYMHNPHSEPIQITEVYSSGGDFHLELPTGQLEGPKDMWEIPPLQTKAVIRVKFQARTEQNHTAYVRIKVNSSEEILVVPLEVEVSSQGGLVEPQGSIDFGVGGSLDLPKEVDLCVHNLLKKAVRIHTVTTTSEAIRVKYENIKLMPGSKSGKNECTKIGTLTLDWKTAFKTQDYSGKITIKYKNGKSKTEVPYYVTVLEGGLSYDPLTTRYFINDKSDGLSSRSFKVKNNFLSSIRLINYTVPEEAQRYFIIEDFTPKLLQSQEEATIFTISLRSGVQASDLKVDSHILVKTNISEIAVPLLSYNGRLQVHLPFKSKDYSLDLGLISFDSKREVHFLVINGNPVGIELRNVKTSIPLTEVALVGCGKGDFDMALLKVTFQNLTKCSYLKTDNYAIVRLSVETSTSEGQIWGDVQIESQYENLSVPVHFKVAPGKLEIGPDRLVFDQCFPGKICSHPLRVHSTFNDPMIIEDIISLPPDVRLSSKHTGHILARATKVIGHLYLDPTLGCSNMCYSGLHQDTTAQWLRTLILPKSVSDFDLNLVNVFYNRYLNVTANGSRRWQNLTLRLDTSEVRGHIFQTRVKMSWPSLLSEQNIENKSTFVFPLTQIGNVSYQNITIHNPSSYNLVVQLVMDDHYPEVDEVLEGLPSNFIPNGQLKKTRHGFFFHESFRHSYYDFTDLLNVAVDGETLPILLGPNQNFTFTVGFRGEQDAISSALILVRNNLTILEVIRLKGQSVHPLFKFGNRKPGSTQPLLFELTEKHAKDCEREAKSYKVPIPSLVVKRSFTAKNTGEITIYINGFYINDMPCEGYGFKMLNCAPFVLHPNGSRKIDMAFTPDLTLSKVTRMLVLDTSLNFGVNYTLHATIPPYYLNLCMSSIVRPSWELYLSYSTTFLMFLLFVFIVLLAVMDAEKIKKMAISALMAPSNLPPQPILDLRLVGQQTRAEIRSKPEEKKSVEPTVKTPTECGNSPPKYPIEKYTVLVPTTGRSKRKLAKKNSEVVCEEPAAVVLPHKKHDVVKEIKKKPVAVVAPVVEERKIHPKEKKVVAVVPPSKKVTPVANHKAAVAPVTYEEESSSTSTESSNNEDNDNNNKEVEQSTAKICSKKIVKSEAAVVVEAAPKPPTSSSSMNFSMQHSRLERRRSGSKAAHKNKEHGGEQKPERNYERKERKNIKERKDKQHLTKKLSNEKHSLKVQEKRDSPPVRVSPSSIASPTIWGENRATFSDVVASSVGRSQNRSHMHNNEQYKQTSPTELGPIGSKRIDFWHDTAATATGGLQQQHTVVEERPNPTSSNSFFSNAQDLAVESSSSSFLDGYVTNPSENWSQNQTIRQLMETTSHDDDLLQGAWNPGVLRSSPTSHLNSYWNNAFTPLAENLSSVQQQSVEQQSSTEYLWSSRVWQPWAPPEAPRTPTKTPPGFDLFLQGSQDKSHTQQQPQQQQQQQRDGYNPFGLNDIWNQQQQHPSPWSYQGQ